MKNFLVLFCVLVLFSCNKNKKIITDGEWLERFVYYNNTAKTDSTVNENRYKFYENGDIMGNKYNFLINYKIKGNKFLFMNHDSVLTSWNITKATSEEFIIESNFKTKYDNRDTIIYRRLIYKKTTPLPNKPYDSVLYNLFRLVDLGKEESRGDHGIVYISNIYKEDIKEFVNTEPILIEPKIKGCVDKTLKILPKKETIQEFSVFERRMFNYYEWETLEFIIKMENYFYFKDQYNDKEYLKVKIWITEK